MADVTLTPLVQQALVLALYGALPPLVLGGLAGALTEFLQGRLGARDSALPAAVRIAVALGTLLLLAPRLGHEAARFATALWSVLPRVGR